MGDIDEIISRYKKRISEEIETEDIGGDISGDYAQFKKDMMPAHSRFESLTKSFGSIFRVGLAEKDRERIQKEIDTAHLDVEPEEVVSFAFIGSLLFFLFCSLIFLGIGFLQGLNSVDGFFDYLFGAAGLFLLLSFVASIFQFFIIYTYPKRLAKLWRLKASSQMVPCILYLVVYMKHTSNLERAIAFASQHLKPPLSLDLKKIFWDVETGKFSTIKESLDNYLHSWEKDSMEFVEAFHLIESSLYEPSDSRRIQTLEKALKVVLDGVYEKMMVFARDIRSPLTNLYMIGIVLPTLGLALLPLATTLLGEVIKFYHVFIAFNIIVPFLVFYLTTEIMMKRPGGYGESDVLELNPDYHEYKSKKPYLVAGLIVFPLILIGIMPFLFHYGAFDYFGLQRDYTFGDFGFESLENVRFFDFKQLSSNSDIRGADCNYPDTGNCVGPYGFIALILSLFIPLGVALFFSIAFSIRTKNLIKSRDDTKQLESEFSNSLFQLGNRIGDGMPAELAFGRVAESTKGQKTNDFFRIVNLNLHQAGMSLERAIFDKNRGAIIYFPSELIATSMRILLESMKKGLKITAESLMSISDYLKNIQKVTYRLNDLLAEVVSDMKGNMVFLAPLLSGIVVGLASMIAFILNRLSYLYSDIFGADGGGLGGLGGINMSEFLRLFDIINMVPPYYLQLAIGIYIIQVIFILSNVLVIIDSGEDKLKKTYDIGKNLKAGMILYFIVTLLSVVVLSFLAGMALAGLG
jgi:Flp pilus assembly protein TadB